MRWVVKIGIMFSTWQRLTLFLGTLDIDMAAIDPFIDPQNYI
jgi:hypothetical protein